MNIYWRPSRSISDLLTSYAADWFVRMLHSWYKVQIYFTLYSYDAIKMGSSSTVVDELVV